ncbi:hypothetical protein OAO01_03990 [Oligoflexia bacterium]|nr:hypothetical protein [Oligoflexia bacterium]
MGNATQEIPQKDLFSYEIDETVELDNLTSTIESELNLEATIDETETCIVLPGWLEAIKKRTFVRKSRDLRRSLHRLCLRFMGVIIFSAAITLYVLYPATDAGPSIDASESVSLTVSSIDATATDVNREDPTLTYIPQPKEAKAKQVLPPQNEVIQQEKPVLSEAPPQSGIIQYAKNKSIDIVQRTYMFLTGTQRGYNPEYTLPAENIGRPKKKTVVTKAPRLKRIPNSSGRYKVSTSKAQWQGGWLVNDPEKNIELGGAYLGYLNSNFGRRANQNLAVFEKGSSSALKSATKARTGPSSSKRYMKAPSSK